ncbi:MAG: zinc-dependent metalloprotease [Acidobacteriota bacterium]
MRSKSRATSTWLLAVASVSALVVGASAQEIVRGVSQGVVTPDSPIFAQDPAPAPQEPETPAPVPAPAANPATPPAQQAPTGRGRGFAQRTYAQLLAEAKTDEGIFKVHRVGDNIYFEIPKAQLGRDFLWVTQIKRNTLGAGYGGQAVTSRVVRWELSNQRVFLKTIDYDVTADPSKPIAQAVADSNNPAIVRAFALVVANPNGDPVIDVTSLFLSEVTEFSPRQSLGARGMDQSRSYLEKVVSFPQNINVQVTQTYTAGAAADAAPGGGRGRGGMRGSSGTIVLFHSLVELPEHPMTPRLYDSRVGYFADALYDYSREEPRAVQRAFINRYRLEKKDPGAALSDPVKPIVYYVDPATPTKFVPWIKKAVEDWQPAFEAAGFSHAIVAKDAPTREEDPDWDAEDVRYSVIRWLPSTTENASGPHVSDPRSGEILDADIQLYHNVQNLAAMWYFTQVGALDPQAQKLPLPDPLMGRLIEFIVAHELGHTLGLRHNMKASSLYTVEQVRDKAFVKLNGHTPSIMDYARFNYVAQPEDGIAVEDLIPKIGAYDRFAIRWGYAPVSNAKTADDERPTLDTWAREQEKNPTLRFMTSEESEGDPFPFDPGEQREAVGDSDPTRATALGLKNLRRVATLLIPATARATEPYDDLFEAYTRVVTQWRLELGHVANVVGGMDSRELYSGQTGVRFTPVPKAKQAGAVQFLLDNAFTTPSFLIQPDLLRRIEPTGVVARVRIAQNSLMNALLQNSRLDRMVEQSAVDPAAYSPLQLLTDLRAGIWRELTTPAAAIDIYRRNVQRVYLDTIDNRLNGAAVSTDEVRALFRGELRAVDQQVARALPAVTDTMTRRHLQDVRETIANTLDPRAMRVRGAPAIGRVGGAGVADVGEPPSASSSTRYDYDHDPFLTPTTDCWTDFSMK